MRPPWGGAPSPAEARDLAWAQRLHFQEMFEFAPEAQVVSDAHGIILETNHACAVMLQRTKSFLIGKPLGLFLAGGHRANFYDHLVRASRHGMPGAIETRIAPPRGQARELLLMWTPMEAEGRPVGFRWFLRDISRASRAERSLRAEQQLLDSVINAAEAIILVTDGDGRVLRSNPYLHAASGYAEGDLSGRNWYELLLPEPDRPAGRHLLEEAMSSGLARGPVLGFQARDGRQRAVAWSARALTDGPIGGVVLVGHDVTDLQEAQQQALQTERLAAIGSVAAGLAHESRNALQRSQACLSMLMLRLKDQPEALDLLERAQKAQDDLHRLYEGVRDYAAPIRLQWAECDLQTIWREAWDDVLWRPASRGAELHEDTAGIDLRIKGDGFRLKRVFRNILENALAARADQLCVDVECAETYLGTRAAVQVRVRDNGPGFPPGRRENLFEPFYTTKPRGTGLGLSICRRILEAHGGRIEAGEGPGPGAEIIITLPRRTP